MNKLASIPLAAIISLTALAAPSVADETKKAVAVVPYMVPPPAPVPLPSQPLTAERMRKLVSNSYPNTHMQRGLYLLDRHDYDHALIEFLKAAQENPLQVKAFYEQAVIFKEKGNLKLAESALQQALAVQPDYRDARVLLASIDLQRGDVSQAAQQLGRSLGLPIASLPAEHHAAAVPVQQTAAPALKPAPAATIVQTTHGSLPLPHSVAPLVVSQELARLAQPAANANASPSKWLDPLSGRALSDDDLANKILGLDQTHAPGKTALQEPGEQPAAASADAPPKLPTLSAPAPMQDPEDKLPPGSVVKTVSVSSDQAKALLKQVRTSQSEAKKDSFGALNPLSWFKKKPTEDIPARAAGSDGKLVIKTAQQNARKKMDQGTAPGGKIHPPSWFDKLFAANKAPKPMTFGAQTKLTNVKTVTLNGMPVSSPVIAPKFNPRTIAAANTDNASEMKIEGQPTDPRQQSTAKAPADKVKAGKPPKAEKPPKPLKAEKAPAPVCSAKMTAAQKSGKVDQRKKHKADEQKLATMQTTSGRTGERVHIEPKPAEQDGLFKRLVSWMPLPFFKSDRAVKPIAPPPIKEKKQPPEKTPLPKKPAALADDSEITMIVSNPVPPTAPPVRYVSRPPVPAAIPLPEGRDARGARNTDALQTLLMMLPKEMAANVEQVLAPRAAESAAPSARQEPAQIARRLVVGTGTIPVSQLVPARQSSSVTPTAAAPRQASAPPATAAPPTAPSSPAAVQSAATAPAPHPVPAVAPPPTNMVARAVPAPVPSAPSATAPRLPAPNAALQPASVASVSMHILPPAPQASKASVQESAPIANLPAGLPQPVHTASESRKDLLAQGFHFVGPRLHNQGYVLQAAKPRLAPVAPAAPGVKQVPIIEDKWTARMRYLLSHGTDSLGPTEAFLYSEETGEGVLFLADKTVVRRYLTSPLMHETVAQLRRPDVLNGEKQYSLSLLGKLIKQSDAAKKPIAKPVPTPKQQADEPFDKSSPGFFGWLKNIFTP